MDALTTLSLLPVQFREVLLLREVQKRSYDEISEALGLSREAVAVRLTGARRELMSRLGMRDNAGREPAGSGLPDAVEVPG